MKNYKYILLILLLLLVGCNKKEKDKEEVVNSNYIVGYSTNILNKEDKEYLENLLNKNNIKNTETILEWIDKYNNDTKSCGITTWKKTNEYDYDYYNCVDEYEKVNKISDGDCRLTSYALLLNIINFNKTKKDNGSYLMFDMDVLENNNDYKVIDKKEFVTLFDEMEISKKEKLEDIYPNKWREYGISLDSKNVSIISVVMHDSYSNVLFIGHAGILIKDNDKYIFIEKLAFEQPYLISVINDVNELKEIFNKRKTYFDNEGTGPYVYQNDKLIFQY